MSIGQSSGGLPPRCAGRGRGTATLEELPAVIERLHDPAGPGGEWFRVKGVCGALFTPFSVSRSYSTTRSLLAREQRGDADTHTGRERKRISPIRWRHSAVAPAHTPKKGWAGAARGCRHAPLPSSWTGARDQPFCRTRGRAHVCPLLLKTCHRAIRTGCAQCATQGRGRWVSASTARLEWTRATLTFVAEARMAYAVARVARAPQAMCPEGDEALRIAKTSRRGEVLGRGAEMGNWVPGAISADIAPGEVGRRTAAGNWDRSAALYLCVGPTRVRDLFSSRGAQCGGQWADHDPGPARGLARSSGVLPRALATPVRRKMRSALRLKQCVKRNSVSLFAIYSQNHPQR